MLLFVAFVVQRSWGGYMGGRTAADTHATKRCYRGSSRKHTRGGGQCSYVRSHVRRSSRAATLCARFGLTDAGCVGLAGRSVASCDDVKFVDFFVKNKIRYTCVMDVGRFRKTASASSKLVPQNENSVRHRKKKDY